MDAITFITGTGRRYITAILRAWEVAGTAHQVVFYRTGYGWTVQTAG